MTNEGMIKMCQTADVRGANWIIPKKVAVTNIYDSGTQGVVPSVPYKNVCILFDSKDRVGIVMPMGVDFHMVTLPEHRGKGHMAEFMRSGIINKLMPELTTISTNHPEDTDEYIQVKHLASLAGLHTLYVPDGSQSIFTESAYYINSKYDSRKSDALRKFGEFDTHPLTESEKGAFKAIREAHLKKWGDYFPTDNVRYRPKTENDIDEFLGKIYDLMTSYGVHLDIASFIIENGIISCDAEETKKLLDWTIDERFESYDIIGDNDYMHRVTGNWWGLKAEDDEMEP